MRLEGKTAIVTGGGSGFGAGIARIFAREGATVMVADINAGAAAGIAGEIGGIAQAVDVSDGASVAAMTEAALTAWGRIDILVNNAGITHLPAPWRRSARRISTASSP
jgi:3-oxoacyl-[acyl-carrier protein] reductase